MTSELGWLVLVALLWGGTNPLLKSTSKEITKVKAKSKFAQFILELKYLGTNIKYLTAFGINQLGSIIYFLSLQSVELSLAVPVANSLTFVFTVISGWILGEKLPNMNTCVGIGLILLGTTLCCYDNYLAKKNMG